MKVVENNREKTAHQQQRSEAATVWLPEWNAERPSEAELLHTMMLEQQQYQMQEDHQLWKEDKKILFTKHGFILWICITFIVFGMYFLIRLMTDTLPDPEYFSQKDLIATPGTVWFMAGLLGFITMKIKKGKYWTKNNTIASVIGALIGLTVPFVQAILMYLYFMVVVMPIGFIVAFFR